jgi:putative transposase
MHRTFRYPLHPTPSQEIVLLDVMEHLRLLYNAALQERRGAWKMHRVSISRIDQTKSLTEIRRSDKGYAACSVEIQRSALRRVDLAFASFFRRCAEGEKPGYPRFKKHGRYKSFSYPCGKTTVSGEGRSARLHIPNFGTVRLNLYRPLKGEPVDVRVKLDPTGKWYAYIVCDLGAAPVPEDVATLTADDVIGVDMGLITVAAFSDGSMLPNPKHDAKAAQNIARLQRNLQRKKKGSNSRRRTRKLLAKGYAYAKDQKLDCYRKHAKHLVTNHKIIAFEDLNITGMVQGPLGKHINQASWRLFRQLVTCKAEEAGKRVVGVRAAYTSQECSGCSELVPKPLEQRWHDCPHCNTSLDRDVNAAKIVKARGMRTLGMSVVTRGAAKATPKARRSRKTHGSDAAELG